MAAGQSAGVAAGNTYNANRGMGRADGKGPAETYGLRTIFFLATEFFFLVE
jgi:hypothetical protein